MTESETQMWQEDEGHIQLGRWRPLGETQWLDLAELDRRRSLEGLYRLANNVTEVVEPGEPSSAAMYGFEMIGSATPRRASIRWWRRDQIERFQNSGNHYHTSIPMRPS